LVEGEKNVIELLASSTFEIQNIFIWENFYQKYKQFLSSFSFEILSWQEINTLSTLQTNDYWIAIVKQKQNISFENNNEYILLLDDIKDPGNLGTIIRIADWYGITKIVCSENTVEWYNPKVIHATMGSFCRIQMYYTNLISYIRDINLPIYWAFLTWENIHTMDFEKSWYILIWNESNGISKEIEKCITKKITIPQYWNAESLNAGIATAIICDNMRRKLWK
jgi:TrmH family RNA methyltransferase